MTAGRRQRAALLALLAALTAFAPMATDLYLPAFPSIAADLGVSVAEIQVTLSASLLGLGLGQLFYGPISDRFGRRRPLVIGIVVFIVASLGCALAPNLGLLLTFRALQALGGCAGIVISRAIVRDRYSGAAMARAFSLVMAVFALAPLLAPTIGAALLNLGTWRILFVFLAIFGLITLIGVFWLPETLAPEARNDHGLRQALQAYAQLASTSSFLRPAFISGLSSATLFSYISSSPAVLIEEFGFSEAGFAITFGGISLAMVVGSQLNIRLLRRFSVGSLLRGYLALQVATTLTLLVTSLTGAPVVVLIALLVVSIATFSGVTANAISEALESQGERAGSASALLGVVQFGLGAFASGALALFTIRASVSMSAAMALASMLALALATYHVRSRRKEAELRNSYEAKKCGGLKWLLHGGPG